MTAGRLNFTGEPPASRGEISLPCFLGWAETLRKPGRLAEQAEALLWAEPKCTMHFLNFLSNSFELIQIKFKPFLNLIKFSIFCLFPSLEI
jgi:hypothetical protein